MEPAEIDRRVRHFILDRFLETATAPAVPEIAGGLDLSPAEAAAALPRLEEARHLALLEGTERILMAFPFSALSTPFRVTRPGGRAYFANCAWDAVAFHPMLHAPVRVDGFCHRCAGPVAFDLRDGRGVARDRPLPTVYLMRPARDWWRDIVRTCANTMVFFDRRECREAWESAAGPPPGAALSVDRVVELSRPIYDTKLSIDYRRPTTEELRATFRRLELTGPFWAI